MTGEIPGNDGYGRSEGGVWDELVLDEAFIRSADPEPRPWRSDEPPAGWFFSKARRRRWRRR
ncbi:hypothetical protein [Streptomyces durhamensis]|uniref:hypothetical protein n=1 Tax=Streptomyces durhamensis TaxID=68194 RepID=UPI0004CD5200|nr:hypothetical protein [Streptomyces durhamensis]